METADWTDFDDEDFGCLSQQACVEDLLEESQAGCLYCRLSELGEEDDE